MKRVLLNIIFRLIGKNKVAFICGKRAGYTICEVEDSDAYLLMVKTMMDAMYRDHNFVCLMADAMISFFKDKNNEGERKRFISILYDVTEPKEGEKKTTSKNLS